MKKMISALLILAMMTSLFGPVATMAEGSAMILPASTREIGEAAFAGDRTTRSIVIPKMVEKIGSKAFSGCTGLMEVYFGNNAQIEIADDAFEGCGDIHFYAFPDTGAELFALSHGYECDVLEEGSSFLQNAFQLVSSYGGTASILQSDEFATMRLIVRMNGNKLPDISEFKPIEILRADDGIFFVQFDSVEAAASCYVKLKADENVIFVDPDACVEVIDDFEAAGTVYGKVWDTEDPMGFDVYAPFVAANGSGRATIAVIDSGVEKKDAYSSILRADGISLVAGEPDWSADSMRHGSMITGIIKDCVGNAGVEVLPIRVVAKNGVANLTMIALGIQYAIEHGADVINLSLNFEENQYVSYWLQKATESGVKVVVAAGNSSRNIAKVYPANVPGVITVSGIDSDYELSAGSNYGDNVSYCAPDTDVKCSAYNGTRTGTSFAAPMVAAALALIGIDGYHSEADLRASCRQLIPAVGSQNNYGHGLMQLDKLARIDAKDIQIDPSTPGLMAVGETHPLKWTIYPENATDQSVMVETDDEDVLKVDTDEEGNVILIAAAKGQSTVTVQTTDTENAAGVSDAITITVVQPVTGISIAAPKTRLALGKTMQVSVKGILPESANNKVISWQVTSLGGEATISESGLITPSRIGRISVTALAQDGYGAVSNAVEIEIIDVPDAEKVVLTEANGVDISAGSIRLEPGDSLALRAAVQPEEAEQEIVWSCISTPEGAVTLDDQGNVKAVMAGSAIVSAETENGISARLTVNVAILPTAMDIVAETIDGVMMVNVGDSIQLNLSFTPDNTTEKGVSWISTNTAVARVDQNGVVTGVSSGKASIVAVSTAVNTVSSAVEMTVRQPYTLQFDANEGNVSMASKTAYSGYDVGDLPTPTRDYYVFDGWYTAAEGGDQVTASSKITASETYTVYAHWTLREASDWVLPSQVPDGAQIIERKEETTTSTSTSLDGWEMTGEDWKQTGTGSVNYAYFPDGFDTNNWIYTSFNKFPMPGWYNEYTKREVSEHWAGYVYWHWMYNTNYSNGTSSRAIYNRNATAPANGFYYQYFGAFLDSTDHTYGGTGYTCNLGWNNYIVNGKTSWNECQGATRWFRFDYYTCNYTDYRKEYSYARELVRYREK